MKEKEVTREKSCTSKTLSCRNPVIPQLVIHLSKNKINKNKMIPNPERLSGSITQQDRRCLEGLEKVRFSIIKKSFKKHNKLKNNSKKSDNNFIKHHFLDKRKSKNITNLLKISLKNKILPHQTILC
jgi:hypothetical protein